MATGGIPAYSEQISNPQGAMSRTWYRFFGSLGKVSGQLAAPIVVPESSFFEGGTLDSGSTLVPNTIPAGTVLGNSSNANAVAGPLPIDASLSLNGGKLAIAVQTADTILGNPGPGAAIPEEIFIGTGLTLQMVGVSWVLNVIPDGPAGTDLAGAQILSWWRG